MDHVAGPELAGVEQAGAVLAATAQAAGAPAEELPPIVVVTPAVAMAVGIVVRAARERDEAEAAWRAEVQAVAGRNTVSRFTAWRRAEAVLALAATALAREVADG